MLVYDFEDCCYFIWATVSWKPRVGPRVPIALKKSSLKIRNNRTKKPNAPLSFTSKCISFASFIIYYLSSHFDTSCLKLYSWSGLCDIQHRPLLTESLKLWWKRIGTTLGSRYWILSNISRPYSEMSCLSINKGLSFHRATTPF